MTLPTVVKISDTRTDLPPVIKVDGKIYKVSR
jgi:hypothetical protein